ncbi:MAG TPA: homoserine dehydrogenase, partial [Candidatus Dormibacteraeota bacterium]|nr:homoserine dehydrogenase [Candidatus Dormibacteraeota bacterium]
VGQAVAGAGALAGVPARVAVVLVRDAHRPRPVALPAGAELTTDPGRVLAAAPDVIVELTGDVALGLELARSALERGVAVVTASKQLVARHGPELLALAAERQAALRFDAAVGGGMPVVPLLAHALRGDPVRRLVAVLNGTTNLILDRMATAAVTLEAAVAEAQGLGLAEADPSDDLDGHDTAAKLVILAALAFGAWPDPGAVQPTGIRQLTPALLRAAAARGYAVRLLAEAERLPGPDGGAGAVALRVAPGLVPATHPLAAVRAAGNGVVLDLELAGSVALRGLGGGGAPTASAVLSDLRIVLDDRGRGRRPWVGPTDRGLAVADGGGRRRASLWHLRPRQPGPAAALDTALAAAGVTREGPAVAVAAAGGPRLEVWAEPAPLAVLAAAGARLGAGAGGYDDVTCLPLLER